MLTPPIPPSSRIVQIAGVLDQAEAEMLAATGVDWLGFPFRLSHHREDLPEAEAARILRALPPPAQGVLITYLDRAAAIVDLCRDLGVLKVQLHGPIDPGELAALVSEGISGLGRTCCRWRTAGSPMR